MLKEQLRPCKIELPERICCNVIAGCHIPYKTLEAEAHNGKFHKWINEEKKVYGLVEYEDGTMHLIPMEYITFTDRDYKD